MLDDERVDQILGMASGFNSVASCGQDVAFEHRRREQTSSAVSKTLLKSFQSPYWSDVADSHSLPFLSTGVSSSLDVVGVPVACPISYIDEAN